MTERMKIQCTKLKIHGTLFVPLASAKRTFVSLATLCLVLLATAPDETGAADKSTAIAETSGGNRIIPPPLEDLGRNYKVRLVYFVPSDCEVKANYREKAEVLMRVVADIYRREMKSNKIKSRGLDFEFDEEGRLNIHLVRARHPAVVYGGTPFNVDTFIYNQRQEIWETTGFTRNRAVLVFSEAGGIAEAAPLPQIYSGFAFVSGDIFRDGITATTIEEQIKSFLDTTPVRKIDGTEQEPRNRATQVSNGVLIHELGHIFGMLHDSSNASNVMYAGYHNLGQMYDPVAAKARPVRFSPPHARMAGATRFLSEEFDEADAEGPTIHQFELAQQPKVGDKTVKVSLKLSDNAGLSSLICMQRGGEWLDGMVGDIDLGGKKTFEKTVTFKCPRPLGKSQPVIYWINVIDVNGNLGQSQLPPTRVTLQ
ncbi:MAG: hypothetical protein O3B95_13070 [Chloroflexi bacterium]|nr:hypothetical protein [Chloroflexota bacterium]